MKISEVANSTGVQALNEWEESEINGVYISDMVSDIITGAKAGNILITLQTHKSLIAAANLVDVGMVVFVRGKKPADDVVELATKACIPLFYTEADTWKFAMKLAELGIR